MADTLWQVYLGRALSGLAAGSLPVATALMADLSPPSDALRPWAWWARRLVLD